jgi:hypothetical protein
MTGASHQRRDVADSSSTEVGTRGNFVAEYRPRGPSSQEVESRQNPEFGTKSPEI